eukprot:4130072-Pyramimonas_sp.AAC.1
MPEEFYYFSGLTAIAPDNAGEWCQRVRQVYHDLDFLEGMSGSGLLTRCACMSGLVTSFPRYFRRGRDLRRKSHRDLVDQTEEEWIRLVEFWSS